MKALHIITPVKNSIDTAIETIDAVLASNISIPFIYTVYNDYSTPENTAILEKKCKDTGGFQLVNISDLSSNPSPNYDLVLKMAQREALAAEAGLLIIESDVTFAPDTIQRLLDEVGGLPLCGMAAAVTVDERGVINYPYEYAINYEKRIIDCNRVFSFCFTLLTCNLLKAIDFNQFDRSRSYFDAVLTRLSLEHGFKNYLFNTLPVLHRPHSSRPWRKIKEKNILQYYYLKLTGRLRLMKA